MTPPFVVNGTSIVVLLVDWVPAPAGGMIGRGNFPRSILHSATPAQNSRKVKYFHVSV